MQRAGRIGWYAGVCLLLLSVGLSSRVLAEGRADTAVENGENAAPPPSKTRARRALVREVSPGTAKPARVRRHEPKPTGSYDALQRGWHAQTVDRNDAASDGDSPRSMRIHVFGAEPVVLVPDSDDGEFGDAQQGLAQQAFGSWEGGPAVNPRLLALIYRATQHFHSPDVHVISGVRRDRSGSRHSHGLAADIVLSGVRDENLAAYFRAQGFVGVGTYPRSGFVHIDVREQSYFWVDRSLPGKKGRVSQVRAAEAREVDQAAVARGDEPLANPERLQRALDARASKRRAKATQQKSSSR